MEEMKTILKPLKLWLVKEMKDRLPVQYRKKPELFNETAWGLALAMHNKSSEINYSQITVNITHVKGKPARTAEGTKNIIQRLSSNRAGLLTRCATGKAASFTFNVMSSLELLAEADKCFEAKMTEWLKGGPFYKQKYPFEVFKQPFMPIEEDSA